MTPKPVLVLDEPTFGQDAKNTFQLIDCLEQFRLNGGTIVMVTHDMEIVRHFSTQQWIIESGVLLETKYREGHKVTYEWKDTWLSEVNPSLKLIITICFFVLVIFIHNPNTLLLILVFSFLLLFFLFGTSFAIPVTLLCAFSLIICFLIECNDAIWERRHNLVSVWDYSYY